MYCDGKFSFQPSQTRNWRTGQLMEVETGVAKDIQPDQPKLSSNQQTQKKFPGQFVQIDPNAKLLGDQQIDGVHLVTDFHLTRTIQTRLGNYANGPTDYFPGMWPITLSMENVHVLESTPYVVSPQPCGSRMFLYVDSSGSIYLENMTQHIFQLDDKCALMLVSSNGRPATETVLEGVMTTGKSAANGENCTKQFTFVIQDAIRCIGKDLTGLNLQNRIDFVKKEIMEPRLIAKRNCVSKSEAFDLDIVDLKEAYLAEQFIVSEFESRFKYPFHSFVFYPKQKVYNCRTNHNILLWKENFRQDFLFRLKITQNSKMKNEAELHFIDYRQEIMFATIPLTDGIKQMDGFIVDCDYVNCRWVFNKLRLDREHPNSKKAIREKLKAMKNPVSRQLLLASLLKRKECDY